MSDNVARNLPAMPATPAITTPAAKSDTLNVTPEQIAVWMKGTSAEQAKAIKALQQVKAATVEKEQANKVSKPRGKGVQITVWTLMAGNPKLDEKQLAAEMVKKGVKTTQVAAYRYYFLSALRDFAAVGLVNDKGKQVLTQAK